jgi:hypothetical protein
MQVRPFEGVRVRFSRFIENQGQSSPWGAMDCAFVSKARSVEGQYPPIVLREKS